jgi:predicted adenine nucleotide alpha hydrolase (AANH) superfamily ATPase
MKVLLHTCCGPCTIYPLKVLKGEGHDVTGFFYNPNIHPYTEFQRRLDTLSTLMAINLTPLVVDDGYDLEKFLSATLPMGKDRCLACYRIRLERAFEKAVEMGSDAVTATLLYSKYQKHEAIAAVAESLSARYGIVFLYRDFRDGWKEGQSESRRLGLYRQSYCGCIFSEHERFAGIGRKGKQEPGRA